MSPEPHRVEPRPDNSPRTAVLFAALLAVLPIILTPIIPLVDLPAHVARAEILFAYDSVDVFREHYAREIAPIPNVAVDVIIVTLRKFLSADAATRVFVVVLVLIHTYGVTRLSRALTGEVTWFTVAAVLTVYNSAFLYGFVNFVLGLGVAYLALALWIEAREWKNLHLVTLSATALLAYLCHLAAYATIVIAAAGAAFYLLATGRTRLGVEVKRFLPLLTPVLLFVAHMGGDGEIGEISWRLSSKLIAMLALVRSYHVGTDAMVGVLVVVVLVTAWRARDAIRTVSEGFAAAGLLGVAVLLSPWAALTGTAVDQRFAIPAMTVAILSIAPSVQTAAGRVLAGSLTLAFLIRLGDVAYTWHDLQPDMRAAREVISHVSPGARVYPLIERRAGINLEKRDRALIHATAFATIDRHAIVPNIMAIRGQQPVYWLGKVPYQDPRADHSIPQLEAYDYVFAVNATPPQRVFLSMNAVPVIERGAASLWRVGAPAAKSRAP